MSSQCLQGNSAAMLHQLRRPRQACTLNIKTWPLLGWLGVPLVAHSLIVQPVHLNHFGPKHSVRARGCKLDLDAMLTSMRLEQIAPHPIALH